MKTQLTCVLILVAATVGAAPLGTEFTYQGVLSEAGSPAAGTFDLRFLLYDADVGGSQVGSIVFVEDLVVADGRLTTQLDFGDVFDGSALWMEVSVRDGALIGSYTVLSPRQELTAAPFAQHSQVADTANTAATAGFATTAGEANTLDGQHGSYFLTWSNFVGIPTDIADGDDDTLADLACTDGEITRWNGSAWDCSSDDDTPYSRTFVVGPVGTTTENGTALRNAIAAITPPTSQEEAVLLKVEPGLYDIGTTGIEIWGWMTIEGAGENSTLITGEVCGGYGPSGSLVYAYSDVELRRMTVENTCSNPSLGSIAVGVEGDRVRIDHAKMEVLGAAYDCVGVLNSGSDLQLSSLSIKVGNAGDWNTGFYNSGDDAELFDVVVEVDGGTLSRGIYNYNANGSKVRSSSVRATGGASESIGIDNENGSGFLFDNVEAFSDNSAGIRCRAASGVFDGVRASGETAIHLDQMNTVVSMVDVDAEGTVFGVSTFDASVNASIRHSRVAGGTNSILRIEGVVSLEGVILIGGPASGGTTCTACMRSGTFNATGCP